jgi:hypothetical protein
MSANFYLIIFPREISGYQQIRCKMRERGRVAVGTRNELAMEVRAFGDGDERGAESGL